MPLPPLALRLAWPFIKEWFIGGLSLSQAFRFSKKNLITMLLVICLLGISAITVPHYVKERWFADAKPDNRKDVKDMKARIELLEQEIRHRDQIDAMVSKLNAEIKPQAPKPPQREPTSPDTPNPPVVPNHRGKERIARFTDFLETYTKD